MLQVLPFSCSFTGLIKHFDACDDNKYKHELRNVNSDCGVDWCSYSMPSKMRFFCDKRIFYNWPELPCYYDSFSFLLYFRYLKLEANAISHSIGESFSWKFCNFIVLFVERNSKSVIENKLEEYMRAVAFSYLLCCPKTKWLYVIVLYYSKLQIALVE